MENGELERPTRMQGSKARARKAILWVLGVLLLVFLSGLLLAPRLIRLEPIREKVLLTLSEELGMQVSFEGMELSWVPIPCVNISRAKIAMSGIGEGTLASLTLYPNILELLKGKTRITRIEIDSPELKITLTKGRGEAAPGLPVGLIMAPLALEKPELEVVLRNGNIELTQEGHPLFSFRNLALETILQPKGLMFRVSCASNMWDNLSVSGRLDPRTFRGQGQMNLNQFEPQGLMDFLFPASPLRLGKSSLTLGANFKMEGLQDLRADLSGSAPVMTLVRNGKSATINSSGFSASAGMGAEGIKVTLKGLTLEKPRMGVSGEFVAGRGEGEIHVQLEGKEVDISSARQTALALLGDEPGVAKVFTTLKGGKAPVVTFQTRGTTWAELCDLDRMVISGMIEEGRVFVPGAELNLENIRGEAVISKGMLVGKNLEARYGNITGRCGMLSLGLQTGDAPFHLDIEVDANLAQIPPVLKRFVGQRAFLSEMEKIHDLEGRAKGKLVLGENTSDIRARVDVHQFDLSARYQEIPYPVKVRGGRYFYEGTTSHVRDLQCQVGKSSVAGLSCHIDWKEEPHMALELRDGKISVEEIFSWVSSAESFRSSLKGIHSLEGEVILKGSHIKGPLLAPDRWQFDANGEVRSLSGQAEFLHGAVRVAHGKFKADQENLVLQDAQAAILDTSLIVSGSLSGYIRGPQKTDLNVKGQIGTRTMEEFTRFSWEGHPLNVRSPLSLEPLRVTWERDKSFALNGVGVVQNGPSITVDMRREPEQWLINSILLKDKDSNVDFSFKLRDREMTLSFSGRLNEKTLDKIFQGYELQDGWLEGDIQVHVVQDRPLNSWARGRVEADDFTILHFLPARVELDRISLTAEGRRMRLNSGELMWADTRFTAQGSLEIGEEGFMMDMDFYTSMLEWEHIKAYLPAAAAGRIAETTGQPSGIPILGSIRVHFGEFTYKPYTWSPFKAEVQFSQQKVEVRIHEAIICGISMMGKAIVIPEALSFHVEALANERELLPSMECFFEGSKKASGDFSLKLDVQAKGKKEELLPSFQGNLTFSARKGRIIKYIMFEKILQFLSLTEMSFGKTPDMGEEGFAYDSIVVKGEIQNGRCRLREAIFDGMGMKVGFEGHVNLVDKTIDGRLLVAPFRTADRVVNFIPVARTIMGGTLVSIPIKVEGSLDAPKLTPLDPSAIGQSLLDTMKRTFMLPVEIFDPGIHKRD